MNKKALLLGILMSLSSCAVQSPPPAPSPPSGPSDEVLIAQEDGKIRAAVVQVVAVSPSLSLPASLALVSAAKGLTELNYLAYSNSSTVCNIAPCSAPVSAALTTPDPVPLPLPAAVPEEVQEGPRPPVDQRKAPIQLGQ